MIMCLRRGEPHKYDERFRISKLSFNAEKPPEQVDFSFTYGNMSVLWCAFSLSNLNNMCTVCPV